MKITIIDENFTFLNNSSPKRIEGNLSSTQSLEGVLASFRKAISELFYNYQYKSSFYMTKTHQHDSFGIYKARVNTDTLGNEKFIVAIVPNDNVELGSVKLLESLKWISFQTRETKNTKKEFNNYNLEPQTYIFKDVPLLNEKIHYEKTTKQSYLYLTENYPVKVEIIPLRKDDIYPDEGRISTALNIFSTIINLG